MVDFSRDKVGDTVMKLMWKDINITGYAVQIAWSGSAKQAARSVDFSVAYSPNDKNVKTLNIKLGDKITFYPGYPDDKKTKFVGIVTNRERLSEAGSLSYTAQDGMIHLLRSSGTYKFAKKTPETIVSMLAKDIKVSVGNLAKTKVTIGKIFFSQRPYYEMIMAAYTKAHRKNKKVYIAQMNGSKLDVVEKGKIIPNFFIKQGEKIITSSYSENLDSMVNRVYIYNSDNKKIGSISNESWVSKYGVFQNAISVDSGNGKTEAKNELTGIEKSASLEAIGDIRCVSGLGVIIKDSRTGLNGKFWIENDTHTWENGIYTMSLELSFQNVMDIQEEDEEDTGNSGASSSGSSGSSALEDVLNQARAWIGVTENPPGSKHNEITQYYGMDDQWCCMFVWACFNKTGHSDLFCGGKKTAWCQDVTDYYKARGKFGTAPKVGALPVYGNNGGGHIGIVESVKGTGLHDFVSIEGNISNKCGRFNGGGRNDIYGFCYPDYPTDKVVSGSSGSTATVTGKAISIPSSIAQTGITGNCTYYPQFYGRWNSGTIQRKLSEIWASKGRKASPENIATIDGYYLIAVTGTFGSVGDIMCVVLENGERLNCIMADIKDPGDDNYTKWGHVISNNGAVDVIEWESSVYAQPNVSRWRGKKVTTIINGGRYSGL